jgi:hypothetical protein
LAEVRASAHAQNATTSSRPGQPPPINLRPAPGRAEIPPNKRAKEAVRTGIPTAVAAAGYAIWDWVVVHPALSAAVVVVIAGAVTILLGKLETWRKQKQETPVDAPVAAVLSRHDDASPSSSPKGSET